MKLYYSKAACSLAPHIVLEELAIPHELVRIDIMKADGIPPDFHKVNPMGAVPVLQLDNGETLTEVAAILQYLADLKPESGLVPKAGTWERVRLQECLNFIATELHKGFGPLFGGAEAMAESPQAQGQIKDWAKKELAFRLAIIEGKLAQHPWIMGDHFTVADAYLFTILSWSNYTGFDLTPFSAVKAYLAKVQERSGVVSAMKAERLIR